MRTRSVHSLRLWIYVTGTRFLWAQARAATAVDADGTPVFLWLAAFREGLHLCKICVEPQGRSVPFVSHGGEEYAHEGTTLLLPFYSATMERVVAKDGEIPEGRRPVEGGYEHFGEEVLFHARAVVDGVSVRGNGGEDAHFVRGSHEM